jgi:hypothetical protein
LAAVLQMGFYLQVPAGSTVAAVLGIAGFSRNYLQDRVKTIFLDGVAVDDLETETIKRNSIIALSAAMPGLVGAIFRKDSPMSGLRSRVEKRADAGFIQDANELVLLKMFNIIAEEMGPELLRNGVTVAAKALESYLKSKRELLEKTIMEAKLDGKPLGLDELFGGQFSDSEHLFVSACEQGLDQKSTHGCGSIPLR